MRLSKDKALKLLLIRSKVDWTNWLFITSLSLFWPITIIIIVLHIHQSVQPYQFTYVFKSILEKSLGTDADEANLYGKCTIFFGCVHVTRYLFLIE